MGNQNKFLNLGFRSKKTILAMAITAIAFAPTSHAYRFQIGDGIDVNLDTTVSYGFQMRAEDTNCKFIGNDNGGCRSAAEDAWLNFDDANLNYEKGDLVSQVLRGVHDLAVDGTNGWKGLARVAWFKDFSIDDTKRTPLPGPDERTTGDIELLDAWVQKDFEIGDSPITVRVGNQVITWGETLLALGGMNDNITTLDAAKLSSPGVQLKEVFLPATMISVNALMTDNLEFEGFYQYGFDAHRLAPSGTFNGVNDALAPGGTNLYLASSLGAAPPGTIGDSGTINSATGNVWTTAELANPATNPFGISTVVPILSTEEPDDSDATYGLSFRYTLPDSGNEIGFYYAKYHEKVPAAIFLTDPSVGIGFSGIKREFVPDRDVFGISTNFKLSSWSWGVELNYRPKDVITIDPTLVTDPTNPFFCDVSVVGTCSGHIEEKKYQLSATGLTILNPRSIGGLVGMLGASDGLMLAEFVFTHHPDIDLTPNTNAAGYVPYDFNSDLKTPTKSTSGLGFQAVLNYSTAFGTRATLSPELSIAHGINGTPVSYAPGFREDFGSVTTALNIDFKNKSNITARVDFTHFYGGGDSNSLTDHDFLGFSLSTSF